MPHFKAELVPAMVTPFRRDGAVDYERMEKLAVHLVENGCDGLLVNGTTGESPTLSFDEKLELVRVVKSAVSGRNVQIMAGVGGNNTNKTIEESRKMASLGVDAILSVVPYYNKPSQRGMIAHFSQIAQSVVDTEIIIYNIPSRVVVKMEPQTMLALHQQCPNIIGVKQSYPDMDDVSRITKLLPADTWTTWCGDDTLTLPMMACGAHGVVSVAAHLVGNPMREMIGHFKAGRHTDALKIHHDIFELTQELFFLPNPTVLKTALARLGMMEPTLRPPLVEPDDAEMTRIDKLIHAYKALSPAPSRV